MTSRKDGKADIDRATRGSAERVTRASVLDLLYAHA